MGKKVAILQKSPLLERRVAQHSTALTKQSDIALSPNLVFTIFMFPTKSLIDCSLWTYPNFASLLQFLLTFISRLYSFVFSPVDQKLLIALDLFTHVRIGLRSCIALTLDHLRCNFLQSQQLFLFTLLLVLSKLYTISLWTNDEEPYEEIYHCCHRGFWGLAHTRED